MTNPVATTAPAPKKQTSKAGLVGLLLVILVPVAMCAPLCLMTAKPGIGGSTVLELDLEQPLDEVGLAGALPLLPPTGSTLMDVVRILEQAKGDDKVKALVARVGSGQSLANVQELREAIASFRASGKPTIAYAESFGEMSPGVGAYVLASAFDEIWLQPSGELMLTGMFGEGAFFRGALDKLGVDPQISGRKEFKNAVNQYTETTFTPPHREATERILASYQEQIVADISASRPKVGDVGALLLGGPLSAQQALERGLIDKLGYKDEVIASLKQRFGEEPKLLWAQRYGERAGMKFADEGGGPVVALVVAKGAVTRGRSGFDPLSGNQSFGSDTTSAAIRAATADDEVRVILLRIDSPGGSYVASDTIWRAVQQARAKGKVVVASMGDLAASGGYFVAMGADRIIADRATLTGSIGVFAGKLVTAGLWEKVGVNFEAIAASPAVDVSLFSNDIPYGEAAKLHLEAMLDRIYLDFTTKAAAGRRLPYQQLEGLAHGRVWTGADAQQRGLVDELGGFLRAVELCAQLASSSPSSPAPTSSPSSPSSPTPNTKAAVPSDASRVRLRAFPREKPVLEQLLAAVRGEPGENSDDVSGAELRVSPAFVRAAALLAGAAAQIDAGVLTAQLPKVLP